MDFMHGGSMWGGMWFIWTSIVVGIALVFYFTNSNRRAQSESPLDILKKRYARGDISKEVFEKMKKDIE